MLRIILTLLVASLFLPLAQLKAETIKLRADMWYPYNGDPNSEKPGYMIEIAREIFTQAGYKLDYQIMPWTRSISQAESGLIDGIVGSGKGDAPEFIFPEEPMGVATYGFFTLPNNKWIFSSTASLSSLKIGTISDYSYGKTFDQYFNSTGIKDNASVLSGDSALEQLVRMLKANRIDLIVSSPDVFNWTIAKMGLRSVDFKYAGELPEKDPIYIAFSPKKDKSPEYAKILSEGIVNLRKSGRLAKILNRYNVADWESQN